METLLNYLDWKTIGIIVLILTVIFGFYKLFKQVEKEEKEKQKEEEKYLEEKMLQIQNEFDLSLKDKSINLDICHNLYKFLIERGCKNQNLFFNRVKLELESLFHQELNSINQKEDVDEKKDFLENLSEKFPKNEKLQKIIAKEINEIIKTTQ